MALRVWLPLNGNLENKGLEGVSSITGSPTYGAGKLGQAITAGGTITFNLSNTNLIEEMCLNKEYSIMAWCYNTNTSAGSRWVFGIGSGAGKMRGFYESNSHSQVHWAFSGSGINITDNIDHMNGWHHICFTVNGTTVTMYIDGIKQGTGTDSSTLPENSVVTIYANNYSLNDFRLYDEALSPKQVKEISRGLVAHYKLEGIGANANLLKGTNQGTNGWTFNVGAYYSKTVQEVLWKGVRACKFGITTGDTSSTSNWRVVEFRTQSFSKVILKPSTTYTISFDTDRKINSCTFRAGNSQHSLGDASSLPAIQLPDGTFHHTIQITTVASDHESWTYDDQFLYMQYWIPVGKFGTIANLKLEEGTIETKWIPHTDDVLYSTLGYGMTIGQDSSGHGYHGTTSGVLAFNSDTSRYEGSTRFTTNAAYIKLPVLTTTGFANSFTIVYWAKIADMSGKMAWGFEDGNRLNIYPAGSVICCNTGDSANNPYQNNGTSISFSQWNDNKWHQFAMTGDGTSNKLYVDGELQGIAKTYKGITGTQMYISGWQSSSTNYRWNNGSISDFRMYATALSADDIKQLYQTSALVDKGQSFYTYEFKEV